MTPIEFYFDFASPYSFLAARKMPKLAQQIGRDINWRPFLIGMVYKEHGGAPLSHPLKSNYVFRDVFRRAKLEGVRAMCMPANFPTHPVPPSRATYWVEQNSPDRVGEYVLAAFEKYWIEGADTSDPNAALEVAGSLDLPCEALMAGVQDQSIKDRLREETENALARGVFGAPFIIIDDEPFWGGDRFDDIAALYG